MLKQRGNPEDPPLSKELSMSNRKLIAISALAITAAIPTLASAADFAAAPCLLREHRVTSVTPYRVEEHMGKATFTRLRGANVFILAEPGLTAEWLQLTLSRQIAEMRGPATMRDCALDVDDVRVQVDSAGTGFSVRLIAREPDKAEEVLRRARLLLG